MAKGNMFLGMARGSVGDVTFYRADGQQLSRVRNRNPRNPKTEAQLYQRAIMATIVKAYQAGKEIFDHSFEGVSVGAGCQRKFMSLNAKMLRQLVANDINGAIPTAQQLARVVAPGVSTPVADPFILSRGSYQQSAWSWSADDKGFILPETNVGETLIEYKQRVGLIAGDIYTFVVFAERKDIAYESAINDDALASQNYCSFGFIRCIVKGDPEVPTEVVRNYGDLFTFEDSGGSFALGASAIANTLPGEPVDLAACVGSDVDLFTETGGIGVIRSRRDQDLRSDSSLEMVYGSTADDQFGIASRYILDEWQNSSPTVGNSELILEGGDV